MRLPLHRDVAGSPTWSPFAFARIGQWWGSKLALVAAVGYLTALREHASLLGVAGALASSLVAMTVAAIFTSVVNDLADIDLDRRAGKHNRLAAWPRPRQVTVVAATLAAGIVVGWWAWRADSLALGLYGAGWLAFALYSLPPVRLKTRGLAGVIADGAGAHVVPTLLIVASVLHATGHRFAGAWTLALGLWSMAHGLRGALWHQLVDRERDAAADCSTYAVRRPVAARRLAVTALPVEVAALIVVLVLCGSPLPLLALAGYAAVVAIARERRAVRLVVVGAGPGLRIVLYDFYCAYLPLAALLAAALRHPADVAILAAHLVLFGGAVRVPAAEAGSDLTAAALAVVRGRRAAPRRSG